MCVTSSILYLHKRKMAQHNIKIIIIIIIRTYFSKGKKQIEKGNKNKCNRNPLKMLRVFFFEKL